jgi:hypothetical protein
LATAVSGNISIRIEQSMSDVISMYPPDRMRVLRAARRNGAAGGKAGR